MKITLTEWAEKNYSPAPSAWVLGQWRRGGQIHPAPERVGREWYVEDTARRITSGTAALDLAERVRMHRRAA